MPTVKFAFAGFRHGHIFSLYNRLKGHPVIQVVAACEPDPDARAAAEKAGVKFTHASYAELLADPAVDVVAVGEAYGNRGKLIVDALRAGKHVLSDKPFCITLAELDAIAAELQRTGLKLGCMLDLRTEANPRTALRLVREGVIGEVQGIQFNGMHPLNYKTGRPDWYFEKGMHGGTINDIGIHAFDYLPYLLDCPIKRAIAAHSANVAFPEVPWFQNQATFMLEFENGAVASGDVSYFAPGFGHPAYWRFTIGGTKGMLEWNYNPGVLVMHPRSNVDQIVHPDPFTTDYLDDFLGELDGKPGNLTTALNLQTARLALQTQALAQ